jgi:hypothetical protein
MQKYGITKDASKILQICQHKINLPKVGIKTLKVPMLEFLFLYLVYEGMWVRSVIPEGGCVVDSHCVFCHCRRILSPLQTQRLKVMLKEKKRRTNSFNCKFF